MKRGTKHTKEARQKISESRKGKKRPPFSQEWRKRIGESLKGYKHTKETKKKVSVAKKGNKYALGNKLTKETRQNMSNAKKGQKSYRWKGGITPTNRRIRHGIEFRLWREAVFARDNWTCQKTGKRGVELHPHHIRNFSDYPDLRFAIDNGITFSKESHNKFHKIYGRKNNTKQQVREFLK